MLRMRRASLLRAHMGISGPAPESYINTVGYFCFFTPGPDANTFPTVALAQEQTATSDTRIWHVSPCAANVLDTRGGSWNLPCLRRLVDALQRPFPTANRGRLHASSHNRDLPTSPDIKPDPHTLGDTGSQGKIAG